MILLKKTLHNSQRAYRSIIFVHIETKARTVYKAFLLHFVVYVIHQSEKKMYRYKRRTFMDVTEFYLRLASIIAFYIYVHIYTVCYDGGIPLLLCVTSLRNWREFICC